MHANDTNNTNKIIYPELSYTVNGLCFSVHNDLGRYAREKQYGDAIEKKLKEIKLPHRRELVIHGTGNILDFLIENKIILEIKAKRMITKEDYFQVQRYLQMSGIKLGLVVNFRDRYLKPIRIVKIDTSAKYRFV
ncbi:MAG: GxxExxY protein [Patescibacteria group bacterium]